MSFVDFVAIKKAATIEMVCERYKIPLRRDGDSMRGCCPIHKGSDQRAFVVTPSKQLWRCFGDCKAGGDVIELVAKLEGTRQKEAAMKIQSWLQPEEPTEKVLKPLDYLVAEHEAVQALGIPVELAKRLGIGHANKGTLSGRVLFPIRDEKGTLLFYLGVGNHLTPPCKLPKL